MRSAAAAAKLLQSCLTLCDPRDSSPPGSPIPGIFQARTLEWLDISFSNAWKWKVKVKLLSRVRLLATPWTAAYQAPPSMGFSRQEYWSGVPLPSSICRVHHAKCWAGWSTSWNQAQAGIKIPRRNINNFRYANDATLKTESEEELKSFLMKVKEKREKIGLNSTFNCASQVAQW